MAFIPISKIIDYAILAQFVIALCYYLFLHKAYGSVIVYFAFVIFLSYWIIKLFFFKSSPLNN